jgi:hypothetical protein
LTVQLPDLFLSPGQIDTSIDLDNFVAQAAVTWTNGTPNPNNINVTIDPLTNVVTVDPLLFVGISEVIFTVNDGFGGTQNDTINVTVDSPPVFDEAAILDEIRFDEDTIDTTLVLVATDVDVGAVLSYGPDSVTAADSNLDILIDQSTGRTTLTPTENWFGSEVITLVVLDQFDLADTIAVNVVVNPVNDPPEFLVKPLPLRQVGVLGRAELDLASRVRDVDDAFKDLQFTFGGADSIAFDVIDNNETMTITPVRPFMGVETVTVVVTDPSEAVDVTTLRVEVLPPVEPPPPPGGGTPQPPPGGGTPQAPEVGVAFLKVEVIAGGAASNITLDDLVSDPDHADSDLTWSISPVSLISVDPADLASRILTVSTTIEMVGYASATLTVTDPTNLQDTLPVRIYAAGLDSGSPQIGGLPDIVIGANGRAELILDDYNFDPDNNGSKATWTATGQQTVTVDINPQSNVATFTAPSAVTNQIEENVTFTATDPTGQTSSDDIQVTLVPAGDVAIDFKGIGGVRSIIVDLPDTLDLKQFVIVGTPDELVWTLESQDSQTILAQVFDGSNLKMIGLVEGETDVVITATNASSDQSSTGTIHVTARSSTNPGFSVMQIGPLTLRTNRDTTINLSELITSGNPATVSWSSGGNANVGVEIDDVNKVALISPELDFIGDAGPIVFTATDINSDVSAFSTAVPVTVEDAAAGSTSGLLEISLIVNPIRKNFLDAFIVSRRELFSVPVVELQVGAGSKTVLRIDPVEVPRIWVGDFIIDDETTGTVLVTAKGITAETRIALADTAVIEIGEAGITSEFRILRPGAEVSLPLGSVDRRTKVVLFESSTIDRGTDQGLEPVSDQFVVHAITGEIVFPGVIGLDVKGLPDDRMGVYRKGNDGDWVYVASRIEGGRLVGDFTAFGTYGAFHDELGATRARALTLHANFPNPFNPQTQIRFDIAELGNYELSIYNILGQSVRSLVNDSLSPGIYRVAWDARDDLGQPVGAGVYLYRLASSHHSVTRKMLLLK